MKKEIIVKALHYSYGDKANVLNDISFEIQQGESVGIIGPNGAGKTTLFLLLCGALKSTSGSINIQEQNVIHKRFNKSIGYVFQNTDDQLFSPTVWDDVAFGPINMRLSEEEVNRCVTDALQKCHCKNLACRPSHHLSSGEKRMVAIATVLSLKPDIIIYDEPTASLDMRARRDVINLIQIEQKTNLIASHDMEFILETCQRVIVIDSGNLIEDGPTNTIMADKQLMENSGLEVPFSLLA